MTSQKAKSRIEDFNLTTRQKCARWTFILSSEFADDRKTAITATVILRVQIIEGFKGLLIVTKTS